MVGKFVLHCREHSCPDKRIRSSQQVFSGSNYWDFVITLFQAQFSEAFKIRLDRKDTGRCTRGNNSAAARPWSRWDSTSLLHLQFLWFSVLFGTSNGPMRIGLMRKLNVMWAHLWGRGFKHCSLLTSPFLFIRSFARARSFRRRCLYFAIISREPSSRAVKSLYKSV